MTEPTPRVGALVAGVVLAIATLSGCVRAVDGAAAWKGGPAMSTVPPKGAAAAPPGIEATLPDHVPPNSLACFPGPAEGGLGTVAQVHDPGAPRLTVTVPDGWTSEPGQRDVALSLSGPDGMGGLVTISETKLDPARAFSDYAATLAHSTSDFQVETLGAKFCGYSSQKLVGTFRRPSGTVEFADRLTHIWTNTAQYLVSIGLQAPEGKPSFAAAEAALMQDFGVVIP